LRAIQQFATYLNSDSTHGFKLTHYLSLPLRAIIPRSCILEIGVRIPAIFPGDPLYHSERHELKARSAQIVHKTPAYLHKNISQVAHLIEDRRKNGHPPPFRFCLQAAHSMEDRG
jgi:hypothetical protein